VGLNSLKNLNLTNGYPNKNNNKNFVGVVGKNRREIVMMQKNNGLVLEDCKIHLERQSIPPKSQVCGYYLVTGTKNPDISEEKTFRISKLFFYITTRGTLKDGQTRFLRLLMKC
jgi:hypothetical protein